MHHVLCLGPIESDGEPDLFMAFAFNDEGTDEPVLAESVADCFTEVRKRHPRGTISCEPEHAKVGERFGFGSQPLPEQLLVVRAGIATTLGNGQAISPGVPPPAIIDLLAASTEFLAAEAWRHFNSDTLFHAQIEGALNATWEASVMGSAGTEYGIGLYTELGTHARVTAARDDAEARKLLKHTSTLSLTFEEEPAFAARAIGELTRLPFVPIALGVDKGHMRPLDTERVLVLAACLRAAASDDRVGTASFEALSVRVTLRAPATAVAPIRSRAQRARRR